MAIAERENKLTDKLRRSISSLTEKLDSLRTLNEKIDEDVEEAEDHLESASDIIETVEKWQEMLEGTEEERNQLIGQRFQGSEDVAWDRIEDQLDYAKTEIRKAEEKTGEGENLVKKLLNALGQLKSQEEEIEELDQKIEEIAEQIGAEVDEESPYA